METVFVPRLSTWNVTRLSRRALLARFGAVAASTAPLAGCTSAIDGPASTELEAHLRDELLSLEALRGDVATGVLDVVDEPVTGGRARVEAGSAQLDPSPAADVGAATDAFERGGGDPDALADNQVGFGFTHVDEPADGADAVPAVGLGPDQDQGTLEIELYPPSDSDYVDDLENAELVVVSESGA